MVYNAPVLQEVGQAANLVLGWDVGHGDANNYGLSLIPALAVGLDE